MPRFSIQQCSNRPLLFHAQRNAVNADDLIRNSQWAMLVNMLDILICLVFLKMVTDYRKAEQHLQSLATTETEQNTDAEELN
jgi:hypothetical protein